MEALEAAPSGSSGPLHMDLRRLTVHETRVREFMRSQAGFSCHKILVLGLNGFKKARLQHVLL